MIHHQQAVVVLEGHLGQAQASSLAMRLQLDGGLLTLLVGASSRGHGVGKRPGEQQG